MNWKKAPALVRELRIAWLIPEVRGAVLRSILFKLFEYALFPFQAMLAIPLIILVYTGEYLARASEKLSGMVFAPSRAARRARDLSIKEVHQRFPASEIRRIMYGGVFSSAHDIHKSETADTTDLEKERPS